MIRPLQHLLGVFVLLHLVYVGLTPFRLLPPFDAVQQVVADLGRPYRKYLGTRQAWQMFRAVSGRNARTEIWIHDGNLWRPIFIARSPEYAWKRHMFEHYRWREMLLQFQKEKERGAWRKFTPWIARQAFEDFPAAQQVRIRVMSAPYRPIEDLRDDPQLHYEEPGWRRTIARDTL